MNICPKYGKEGVRRIPGHPYVSCACQDQAGARAKECWLPADAWIRLRDTATKRPRERKTPR
jgi:hypothetical protein